MSDKIERNGTDAMSIFDFFSNNFLKKQVPVPFKKDKPSGKSSVRSSSAPTEPIRKNVNSENQISQREITFDPGTFEMDDLSSIDPKGVAISKLKQPLPMATSPSKLIKTDNENLLDTSRLFNVDDAALKYIEPQFAAEKSALPLELNENVLTVVCANKIHHRAIESHISTKDRNIKVSFLFADDGVVKTAIEYHYLAINKEHNEQARVNRYKDISMKLRADKTRTERPRLVFSTKWDFSNTDTAIRELIENLLCDAHWKRATDIDFDHFINTEPDNDGILEYMLCRIRVDGEHKVLHKEKMSLEKYRRVPHILKILAGLKATNLWDGQSGVIRTTLNYATRQSEVECRANFIPMGNDDRGESISIRLQEKDNFPFDLDSIGLRPEQYKLIVNEIMFMSAGMGIVAGPINEGKNSTMVCILRAIHEKFPAKKIVMVEDPVEFNLPGITQISVDRNRVDEINGQMVKRGFSYYLPPILRHSPNILSIGEIRESESANMAIECAGIGHLMISTIHTKSAIETITRLRNLQVEDYKIAANLGFVISQRLVKKICSECTVIEDVNLPEIPRLQEYIQKFTNKTPKFSRATGYTKENKGCIQCNGTGFYGRTGVFEILILSNKVKELIAYGAKPSEIQRQILHEGFKTLWMNGLQLVLDGVTTLAEIVYHIGKPDPVMEGLNEFGDDGGLETKYDLDAEKAVC